MKNPLKNIMKRRTAWREIFKQDDGGLNQASVIALAHLQRFCYANRTTAKISPKTGQFDPIAMAMAEGRREVFLFIQENLKLDDSDLQRITRYYNQEAFDNE